MRRTNTALCLAIAAVLASIAAPLACDANDGPDSLARVRLAGRVAGAPRVRVFGALGRFELREARVIDEGLSYTSASGPSHSFPRHQPEIVPWNQITQIRVGYNRRDIGRRLGALGLGGLAVGTWVTTLDEESLPLLLVEIPVLLVAVGIGWLEGGFVGGLTWRWETVYRVP